MMTRFKTAGCGSLLLLSMLCLSTSLATAGTRMALGASPEIPAAEGEARFGVTHNGNVQLRLNVHHLAPPGRVVAGADVFVVWVRGLAPGALAQNLGALRVDRNLSGKLTAVTPMRAFDLFVTCEQSQTALVPAPLELLPVHFTSE